MNDPTLEKIVSVIVRAVQPNKIILFGSRARGEAIQGSDYDLVIIKDGEINEHATSTSIYLGLAGEMSIVAPVDIIPISRARFMEKAAQVGSPMYEAARKGITIYAG